MIQPLAKLLLTVGVGAVGFMLLSDSQRRRAALQAAFESFHDAIKHEQFTERALLRERRELLLKELGHALPADRRVRAFDQGSYAMQTGVVPLDGDFDIDIGLAFDRDKTSFESPLAAKQLVRNALARGSRSVSIRRSCVTAQYIRAGAHDHHVDIAVYAPDDQGRLWLAKGKEFSKADLCFWELSDPEKLTLEVNGKFRGAALAQFRRSVRMLKRWKHLHFTTKAPHSIALTIAAYHWFSPSLGAFGGDPDDLDAMLKLVTALRQKFRNGRLCVVLPVDPGADLLATMTGKQMNELAAQLDRLGDRLRAAVAAQDLQEALEIVAGEFGDDFPV